MGSPDIPAGDQEPRKLKEKDAEALAQLWEQLSNFRTELYKLSPSERSKKLVALEEKTGAFIIPVAEGQRLWIASPDALYPANEDHEVVSYTKTTDEHGAHQVTKVFIRADEPALPVPLYIESYIEDSFGYLHAALPALEDSDAIHIEELRNVTTHASSLVAGR